MNDDELLKRLLDLVEGLIMKSGASNVHQLKWEKVGEDTFEISLTRTTLQITSRDGDGQYPFLFTILDEHGNEVDRLWENADSPNYKLKELYIAASRSHSGIEQKLDDVFRELGIRPRPDAELPRTSKTSNPWGGTAQGEPPF